MEDSNGLPKTLQVCILKLQSRSREWQLLTTRGLIEASETPQPARKEILINDQPHGRYFAQELVLDQDMKVRESIQEALDAGERKEWHLVGVSDVPPENLVVLFWDTARPSFGRSTSH